MSQVHTSSKPQRPYPLGVGNAIVRTGAWLSVVAALALMGAWGLGRLTSDHWEWSQFLYWLPTPAVLLASLIGLLTSAGLSRWARGLAPTDTLGRRAPAARTRLVTVVAWVAVLL